MKSCKYASDLDLAFLGREICYRRVGTNRQKENIKFVPRILSAVIKVSELLFVVLHLIVPFYSSSCIIFLRKLVLVRERTARGRALSPTPFWLEILRD